MIVRDIDTVKKYLGINAGFKFTDIEPYIKRAERKYLIPVIGTDQYNIFNATTQPSTDNVAAALAQAQEAVSNLAYYLALPILHVQVSSAGIFVPNNESTAPASDKHFKELQRSFKTAGHEAIDALLDFMEANIADFTDWESSPNYVVFKELLVYNTATFQQYYNINYSRLTFLALVPNIKVVEDQFICGAIGPDVLAAIKANASTDAQKQAKKYLIQSIVAYTIYKTVDNGLFRLAPNGIHLRFDVLPYERVMANTNYKINDFLIHTKNNKLKEAEEYLKLALDIISNPSNATDFPDYSAPTATADKIDMVKTQGIIGI